MKRVIAIFLSISIVSQANATIILVAHTGQGSNDTNGFTTSAIDTTGSSLLVACVTDNAGTATIADSKSNTWVSAYTVNTVRVPTTQMFYVKNPTVGAGHTFTLTSSGESPSVYVLTFSGTDTSQNVDQSATNFANFTTTAQAGSVIPSLANEVLVACAVHDDFSGNSPTIDSSFNITDTLIGQGSGHFGGGAAYLVQTTAIAENPTWTLATANFTNAGIATFKAAPPGITVPMVHGMIIQGSKTKIQGSKVKVEG